MGWLVSLLFKLPGIADGILGYLQKKQDVGLETYKTGVQADAAINIELIKAQIEDRRIVAQQRAADRESIWTAWMLPTAFGLCVLHYGAIVIDSLPLFGHVVGSWSIPALPAPYDTIQQSIILTVCGVAGVGGVAGKIVGRIFSR